MRNKIDILITALAIVPLVILQVSATNEENNESKDYSYIFQKVLHFCN